MNFVRTKKAIEILGINYQTLHKLSNSGEIEVIRPKNSYRLYNINGFINKKLDNKIENINKRKICYCRVSTLGQKDDLKRQIDYMKNKYKDYETISDISSGLNFKRKGLTKIINYALNGEIEEIVVAYKDRLSRFGFELIEHIVKEKSNGKITVLNNKKDSPEEEIVKDLVQIINVFSARVNGLRKYKKEINDEINKKE